MRKRILRYGLLLFAAAVIVTGVATGMLFHRYYVSALTRHMSDTVRMIGSDVAGLTASDPGDAEAFRQAADRAAGDLDYEGGLPVRVTLIAGDGTVLADSMEDPAGMENHSGRPEVMDSVASPGEIAVSSRHSDTVGYDMLYVARYDSAVGVIVRAAVPLTVLRSIYLRIALFCLLGFAAGLIVALPLSYMLSDRITRPIARLAHASHQIAEGQYDRRIELSTGTEFDDLAADFNFMAGELKKTVGQLTDRNDQLGAVLTSMASGLVAVDEQRRVILINPKARSWLDLPEDMAVEGRPLQETIIHAGMNTLLSLGPSEGLRVEEFSLPSPVPRIVRVSSSPILARDQTPRGRIATIMDVTRMRALEKMRSDFVANVTHELRTPLTSIKGYVETLRSGAVGDPAIRERFLQIIDIEAERLHSLITDVLELSDIEAKTTDTGITLFSLSILIGDVVDLMAQKAREKSVTIRTDVPETLSMTANPDRIKQMLLNLVDNAVKYNVEGGSVSVGARRERGKIIISVKDTGIGIAEEHLSRIFERFYRVDKSRSRQMGGTGLGLSIVKHIAGLYGGNVRIESAEGEGTRIIVELPLRQPVRSQPAAPVNAD